ncbi:acyltransferase family protein [Streptomyces sp. C184]|uniref:acyltransferase family protein n=1 Tax=Streptomyces sp. C184 TaxID=3237121 RepID=UPI0034C6CD19
MASSSSSNVPSSTASSRLHSLTGLRFVAALCVVLEHLSITAEYIPPGRISVSFFFVLSGFVLTWSVRPDDSPRSFWRRRFWKIFPNHVVTWTLMMALLAAAGISLVPGVLQPGATAPAPAVANLFLWHPWVPSFEFLFSVNPVSWSLGSELLFYALFPALLPLVLRIRQRRLGLAAVGLVALVWLVPLVSLSFSGRDLMPGLLQSQYWFDYFFPLSRLPEFILGMVLARMVRHGVRPRVGVALPGIVALVVLTAATRLEVPAPFMFTAVTIVPIALVVLGAASMDVRGIRSLWRTPVMAFLGDISFALYLVHPVVNATFDHLLGTRLRSAIGEFGEDAVIITLCLVAAWVLFRTVERPLMRRFGSVGDAAARGTAPDAAPESPARY